MSLIIKWQMGDFGEWSWRALNLSIRLMQRLEPTAWYAVIHQGAIREKLPHVAYYQQEPGMYSHGRFEAPEHWDDHHMMYLENDHIMWSLPPAWERWRMRSDASLVWIVDWDYYGNYAERVGGFRACPGMFGLPPKSRMPFPPVSERGDDQNEQGFIAVWLKEHPPHEIVTHDEVSAYMPNHDILKHTHSKLGTHGVHLPGLNRGWSRGAEELIVELERKYL